MTLQWTFVATCLYIEIAIIVVLLLPFISPTTWQKVFRSNLVGYIKKNANMFFYIFVAILLLLFFESVREVNKYSEPMEMEDLKMHPEAETLYHMKLFRAQRNLYIAGFALFLNFVIRRLVVLISTEATLMAESMAAKRQAESATAAAQSMLDAKDKSQNDKDDKAKEKGDNAANELQKSREQLEETKEDLYKARLEFEAMKKQAESVTTEYDRLLEEHSKLQKKLAVLDGSGDSDDKKGN